jgi:hypothetical protein
MRIGRSRCGTNDPRDLPRHTLGLRGSSRSALERPSERLPMRRARHAVPRLQRAQGRRATGNAPGSRSILISTRAGVLSRKRAIARCLVRHVNVARRFFDLRFVPPLPPAGGNAVRLSRSGFSHWDRTRYVRGLKSPPRDPDILAPSPNRAVPPAHAVPRVVDGSTTFGLLKTPVSNYP